MTANPGGAEGMRTDAEVAELARTTCHPLSTSAAILRLLDSSRSSEAALRARVEALEGALRSIRDDFDCDNDAHRYGTMCRCCEARRALAGDAS